jgi:mRNA interferase RelE/StbE
MTWSLVIVSAARKELRRVPRPDLERIDDAFQEMSADPFAGDVKALRGTEGAFRRRIGDWRILFDLHQHRRLIVVTGVKRRGSKTY